ncbi:MAG TPA: uroporphyrinogen-III C-methyltransferase [Burkholderiaceae bacterium]|nr:uroporphyrinogen-III C-methyltransferase [Burkholderiaceae bacterium]
MQGLEQRLAANEQQLRSLQEGLRDAQSRNAVLDSKLGELVGEQAQLRQFYDQFVRARGDAMLADVEQSLMIANQYLQFAGNVQAALIALQEAEQRLAQSNQPAVLGLRRAISADIERLRALPATDIGTAITRLDSVLQAVDQLPLLADVRAAAEPARPPQADEPPRAAGLSGLTERLLRTGIQGWESFVSELRQLFRVQRVDQPDALLLAPDQRFFVRENLRLLLLHARLNLMARNEPLFRADLARAIDALERYFDRDQRAVAAALAALRPLQGAKLTTELPALSESLAAVRSARAASERR